MVGICYLDGAPPRHGRVRELYPGLYWARIELPFRPSHVNVWLLSEIDGWTIVDTGFDSEAARSDWTAILDSLGNPPIKRVVLTHAHLDHIGLAGWLCAKVGAPLWVAQTEFFYAKYLQSEWSLQQAIDFYRRAGSPASILEAMPDYQRWVRDAVRDVPASFFRVQQGDRIVAGRRVWKAMASGGHALEQLAFWCEQDNLLIAGDQVLPKIHPAIQVTAEQPEADPLSEAFAGWARLRELPPETVVLPSHGEPFQGMHHRLDQMVSYHDERLGILKQAARDGLSPHEALEVVYGKSLPSSPRIATGEMLAYLANLAASGSLTRTHRPEGVLLFRGL